jgi:hypothetical protein
VTDVSSQLFHRHRYFIIIPGDQLPYCISISASEVSGSGGREAGRGAARVLP